MVVDLNELLPVILYVALIVLVVILIVLGIKLIRTLKKLDIVIEDINSKMNRVDGLFNIIDRTTDFASSISDKVVSSISSFINVLVRRKRGNDEDE